MAYKSAQNEFESSWNKAVAWAQSNGISADAYLPVYQMDSLRLQSGEEPMSGAERNRAILAASNPNDVTSLPSDNPSPSSIFGNMRSDLGMIATGLEPTHLISNLFDTVVNTAKDIIDPRRLIGNGLDATAANALQDTLLSFVPGAYDLGTFLRAGGGLKGFDALADHPLVSLLDALPVGSGEFLTGALADTALGGRLAEGAGLASTDVLRNQSLTKTLTQLLTNNIPDGRFRRVGVDPGSAQGGISTMSIGQRLQSWLSNSKLGTSAPIQQLVSEYMLNNQLYTGIAQNILAPAIDAWSRLSDDEKKQYDEIFLGQSRGDDIERLLKDPDIPLAVRDAAQKMLDGPLRFETEEAIAARDVTMVRRPDGSLALYSAKQATDVLNARDPLKDARVRFVSGLDATDPLRQNVEAIDARLPQMTNSLEQANKAARQVTGQDQELLANVVEQQNLGAKQRPHAAVLGTKRQMAQRLFGDGGMVDAVLDEAKSGHDESLSRMVDVLQSRLDRWGAYSVDASSNPAFAAVKAQVDQLAEMSKTRVKLNDEIDRRINEEPSRVTREIEIARQEQRADQIIQRQELTDRQRNDVEKFNGARRQAISKARSDREVRIAELDRVAKLEDLEDTARGDNAAARATRQKTNEIDAEVRQRIAARHKELEKSKNFERKKYQSIESGLNKKWDEARGALRERHATERQTLKDVQQSERRGVGGPLRRQMQEYLRAVGDFHKAVYDNPSDEYRDMRSQIYEEHLLASDKTARLLDATEKRLVEKSHFDGTRLQQVRSNPAVLRELVAEMVEDVYKNPQNFDPELVDAVTQAHDDAVKSAVNEINTLMSQGFRPMWLPAASPFDSPSWSVKSLIGKGTPHVQIGDVRKNELVNTRYSVVLGATKHLTETLKRDATIDFFENSVVPRTITGEDLRAQLDQMGILDNEGPLYQWNPNEETITSARSVALAKLGLSKVPDGFFPLSQMPRYEGKALYMPSGLVTALEKMKEVEGKGDTGIFDKTNKLFRYSILGLSPRYTAHILFGGTFLLALRSTPFLFRYTSDAAKALRDGSLPQEIFRTPTQEGVTHLTDALQELHWSGGKQLANLVTQEHLSVIQKITEGKASPIHILKAAADINYRFTRYAVRMQSAMAYLDYAARAERKGSFIDEVTGETRVMTKERAMQEGMKHVEEVFGNLRSMSPLERQVAKNIMPFYGWTRHILNYVLSYPSDHPWRAMALSLMAFENSADVPKGLPERIQFLFFFGSPDAQGNVTAVDDRFMDPLRDVANYATLGGWLQALNPALLAPLAIMNPEIVYGSNELYPNVTYNQFYGIETASTQGNWLTGLEQFVPQLGALPSAFQAAQNYRSVSGNPNEFYKTIFEALNVPFLQVQKINVKQIAAHDEIARYEVAKQAAQNAFESGDFSTLQGYSSVPNPLNPDYDISPAQLQAVYNYAAQEYPGTAPIEVLTPPPTPLGF